MRAPTFPRKRLAVVAAIPIGIARLAPTVVVVSVLTLPSRNLMTLGTARTSAAGRALALALAVSAMSSVALAATPANVDRLGVTETTDAPKVAPDAINAEALRAHHRHVGQDLRPAKT